MISYKHPFFVLPTVYLPTLLTGTVECQLKKSPIFQTKVQLVQELFDPSRNRLGTLFQTKCDLTRTGEVRMLKKSETPVGEHVEQDVYGE